MDEIQEAIANVLIKSIQSLWDGPDEFLHDNPEYARGQAELLGTALGIPRPEAVRAILSHWDSVGDMAYDGWWAE